MDAANRALHGLKYYLKAMAVIHTGTWFILSVAFGSSLPFLYGQEDFGIVTILQLTTTFLIIVTGMSCGTILYSTMTRDGNIPRFWFLLTTILVCVLVSDGVWTWPFGRESLLLQPLHLHIWAPDYLLVLSLLHLLSYGAGLWFCKLWFEVEILNALLNVGGLAAAA